MCEIETERLLLRRWRDEDLEPYVHICADPEVMRYIGDGSLRTREHIEKSMAKFARYWKERGFGLWAVEEKESGALVGFTGLLYQEDWPEGERKVEVGWRLGKAYWNRGYAIEAARVSLHHGFEELGIERIISMALPANVASQRVMEKIGMSRRGEARWRDSDVVWYAVDRRGWLATVRV